MADQYELETLLRLKRYEQPPEAYYQDFLKEFQRRQREELLRRPIWQIALDRIHGFVDGLSIPRPVLVSGFASILLLAAFVLRPDATQNQVGLAAIAPQTTAVAPANSAPTLLLANLGEAGGSLPNNSSAASHLMASSHRSGSFQTASSSEISGHENRHYVMDVRPVSFDSSISF